ncbi:MAG: hypothetical protein IJQ85_09615 [Selenomonadaceae bacterium]|nr:hypothetical protein [Selenomonadaceae bacterium]
MKIIVLKFPYVSSFFCEKSCEMIDVLKLDFSGFVSLDLNEELTSYNGYPIYPLKEINNLSWDIAIYGCEEEDFEDILPRMIELGIGKKEQFKNIHWFLQQFMIKKYEDFNDAVIQETLEYWKTHDISVFNQHVKEGTLDKVFFDETCDLPYVNFKTVGGESRKMYYPKDYDFHIQNGEPFVKNLLTEQQATSPHLYITDNHKVDAGDIVIDAGVCEGNFALKYVDICSKMYLFEPEEKWQEPLRQTFKDYHDKVEIIPRFLSNGTEGNVITIDDALPDLRGKNIFLKMDIEGYEPYALRGAKRILTNNKVKASVCTYHYADELIRVKSILQSYGYKTSTSAGYMVFLWDIDNIWNTADFRKGMVYAAN